MTVSVLVILFSFTTLPPLHFALSKKRRSKDDECVLSCHHCKLELTLYFFSLLTTSSFLIGKCSISYFFSSIVTLSPSPWTAPLIAVFCIKNCLQNHSKKKYVILWVPQESESCNLVKSQTCLPVLEGESIMWLTRLLWLLITNLYRAT